MASDFAATTAAPPPALEGTAWTLAALPGASLLADRPATLRVEGGQLQLFDAGGASVGLFQAVYL